MQCFHEASLIGAAEVQALSIQPLSQVVSISNLELCTNYTYSVASVQTEAVRMAGSAGTRVPVGSSPGDGPPVSLHWLTLQGPSLRCYMYQVASSGISIL